MEELTWSPGLINGLVNYGKQPPSNDWVRTSTKTIHLPFFGKNGGNAVMRMPVYTKKKASDTVPIQETLDPTETAKPVELDDVIPTPVPEPITPEPDPYIPPIQDFRFDEQAAAQESYLDDMLTRRMEKFQRLLDSIG